MDRRFLTWLMLTTALCFLYLSMRNPPAQPKPADAPAQALAEPDDPLLRENPEVEKPEVEKAADGQPPVAEIGAAPELDPQEAVASPVNPSRAITLGSMDPTKGYNLLVTFTTRGAGIERAELVARGPSGKFAYRALEHDSGYLGYLGLSDAPTGLQIRTVPDGSPAALATSAEVQGGLQVEDVLTEFAGQSIDSSAALERAIAKTKPGDQVELIVQRGPAGQRRSIKYAVTLAEAPLDVLRMRAYESELVDGNYARPSLRTTLASLAGTNVPVGRDALPALRETLHIDWEVQPLAVPGGEGLEFRLPLESFLSATGRPAKLELVKRYRLLPVAAGNDGYLLDLETTIVNRNEQTVKASFRQEGLAGMTLEGWWYSVKISQSFTAGAGNRDVAYASEIPKSHALKTAREIYYNAKKSPSLPDMVVFTEDEPLERRNLKYIGLDTQYFNASILPHPDQPDALNDLRQSSASAVADVTLIPKAKSPATNTSFWFDTQAVAIPAGGEISQQYQVFIGPKDSEILATHGLGDAIEYGWFPLVAKPLGAILHFFHYLTRNYALAIILLTVCVRGAMFPLGKKAAMNAQRMQELQPELAKINERYKDNMEKRAKAMQELYAKHNFKPLAGCLPMFIQLPIFIGLYRCLSVDIALRQAPLIPGMEWCSNLSGPDQLLNWSSWMPDIIAGRGTGWLGPYFNVLPMVTVVLFLLQQKMLMPKATDEQTRMTQNMMQVMTLFMGVLFFKVPSGLCIYFITSSCWSLVERKLIKRMTPAKPLVDDTTTIASREQENDSSKKTAANRRNREPVVEKPKSRFEEVMQMLEKPAVKSSTQRGTRKEKKRRR
ncbi:MAG: YidC/Oxa1 family insertase periplasmic-domain containing protein [Pirellulaceae bacterium]